jgi:hypothetical protein
MLASPACKWVITQGEVLGTLQLELETNGCMCALTPDIYNDLLFYFKYASSAYSTHCRKPNGNVLVKPVRRIEFTLSVPNDILSSSSVVRTLPVAVKASWSVMTVARKL